MATLTKSWQLYGEKYIGSASGYDKLYLRLYAKYNDQNVVENNTTYTTSLRIYNAGSYAYAGSCNATLDGYKIQNNSTLTFNANSEIELGTKVSMTTHDNEGYGSIHPTGSFSCYGGVSGDIDAWIDLPKIARKATINSFSGNDINSSFNVTFTKYNNSFSYKLRISIPNVVALQTKDYNSGESFTLDASSINQIYSKTVNSSTVQLEAVVETWSGTTKIGESSGIINVCNITNSNPTFGTPTYQDTNTITTGVTKNNQVIVKDKSTIRFTIPSLSSKNSATLVKLEITVDNLTKTVTLSGISSSQTVDFGTINSSSNVNAVITLTDSRGFTVSKTLAITVNDYSNIAISSFDFKRLSQTSSTVKLSLKGTFYNNKIGSIANKLIGKYRYRESNGTWSNYITLALTKSNNDFSYTNNALRTDCNHEKYYEFEFVFTDKISTYTKNSKNITKGIPVYDYGEKDFRVNGSLRKRNVKTSGESITGEVYGGTVLYNSETGSNGAITLSDTSANYTFFDIYFKNNDDIYSFTRVYNPNGKKVELLCTSVFTNVLYLKGRTISIDEENITTADTNTYTEIYIMNGSYNVAGNNQIYITTVIGYI